jgi:hypothetical protein
LRQPTEGVGRVRGRWNVPFGVLLAEAALPGNASVFNNEGRQPGDAGLLAERVHVPLEQRVGQSLDLSGPGGGHGKGGQHGDGDHTEASSHGADNWLES